MRYVPTVGFSISSRENNMCSAATHYAEARERENDVCLYREMKKQMLHEKFYHFRLTLDVWFFYTWTLKINR